MLAKNQESLNNNSYLSYIIMDLIIAKQRNGPTGSLKLKFNKNSSKFLNF